MTRPELSVMVPAVIILLLLNVEAKENVTLSPTSPSNNTANEAASQHSNLTISSQNLNKNTTSKTTVMSTSSGTYFTPHVGAMLKRLVYVTLVLSGIIGIYLMVKFCKAHKRKPRKYGVVKTPGDAEMRPLESDDEDDDDVTMFNRK